MDDNFDFFSKTNISYKKGNAASVGNGEIFAQRGVVSQTLQFQPIFSLLSPGEEDDMYAALNEGNIVSNPYTLAKDVLDLKKSDLRVKFDPYSEDDARRLVQNRIGCPKKAFKVSRK